MDGHDYLLLMVIMRLHIIDTSCFEKINGIMKIGFDWWSIYTTAMDMTKYVESGASILFSSLRFANFLSFPKTISFQFITGMGAMMLILLVVSEKTTTDSSNKYFEEKSMRMSGKLFVYTKISSTIKMVKTRIQVEMTWEKIMWSATLHHVFMSICAVLVEMALDFDRFII